MHGTDIPDSEAAREGGRLPDSEAVREGGRLPDPEAAMRDDIRLLGRVLGDTVRQQQGEAVYATVERIRQTSIQFRRDDDQAARRELEATLDSLSGTRTIEVVRAFSYFSHLANIAEDQHNIRSGRALTGAEPQDGTLAAALARARKAGLSRARLQALFGAILVSPVLTAHPTEVRRKSVLDREMEIAQLLAARERVQMTPEETAGAEEALLREVLTLWQTSLLRHDRPTVIDEVTTGLSYYDHTFLRELPRLYGMLEDQLAAQDPAWNRAELPAFLRIGSWIGGDRDGNPFVNADVLRQTIHMQSRHVIDHYLEELHLLGGELSLDLSNVSISRAVAGTDRALARHLAAAHGGTLSPRRRRHLCQAGRGGSWPSAMTCCRATR